MHIFLNQTHSPFSLLQKTIQQENTWHIYQFVQDLNPQQDDWVLKVRVVRLWNAFTSQNDEDPIYIEMILLDEKVHIYLYNFFSASFIYLCI